VTVVTSMKVVQKAEATEGVLVITRRQLSRLHFMIDGDGVAISVLA